MITREEIRSKRVLKNLNQNQLAEKAGVSITSVVRIESEKYGPGRSTPEIIKKIFGVLEIDYELTIDGTPVAAGDKAGDI